MAAGKKLHPIILINYVPRFAGNMGSMLIMATILAYEPTPLYIWLLAFAQAIIWPNFCLLASIYSKNPKELELKFLLIDSFANGCWVAYVNFQLWIVACAISSVAMGNISINGFKQYLLSLTSSLLGAFFVIYLKGFSFQPESSLLTTIMCIIALHIFMVVMGYLVYVRSFVVRMTKKQLEFANQEITHMQNVFKEINTSLDIDRVIETMMPFLRELFPFDNIGLQIADFENDRLSYHGEYGKYLTEQSRNKLKKLEIKISEKKSMTVKVLNTKKLFYEPNVTPETTMYDIDREVYDTRPFHSILMLPIEVKDEAIGVITFFGRYQTFVLTEQQIEKIKSYLTELSIVINNAIMFAKIQSKQNQLNQKNDELLNLSNKLSRYLSPQIYKMIFSTKDELKVEAKRKNLTIFFSDIAGFTDMTDRVEAELLTNLVNEYLTEMSSIAIKYGGTIDKYIGDGIMIFFGDPESRGLKQDALNCVLMAIDMQAKLAELSKRWGDEGFTESFQIRIGINSGYCAVGNFGSGYRLEYTLLGGQVNLANRLQTTANPGEIIISKQTYLLIKDAIECESRGDIKVKGIAHPIPTYIVKGKKNPT